jgi:glycosyltransferase involved in cell wall biosynthesis
MKGISVVIPTCNRRARLLALLEDLGKSSCPPREVLIVDSSDLPMDEAAFLPFPTLRIRYITSRKSVCVQRNLGIKEAAGEWIFLCDDDIEVPIDYLARLSAHLAEHPEAGAVSGLVRQREGGQWVDQYPLGSSLHLLWRWAFQLGIWGEIQCRGPLIDWLVERYHKSGNHLSKAGWPVVTEVRGAFFRTPIYGLGASLVRKDWLLASPYDESLDAHGMGDNYGVAIGFPAEGIHVVTDAYVYHHEAQENRLPEGRAYARRLMALDHFIRTRKELAAVESNWFLWSLVGSAILHGVAGNPTLCKATLGVLGTLVLRPRNAPAPGRP